MKKALDFVDCVSFLDCPSVNKVHGNVTHNEMRLQFCLGVCGHLVGVMHYVVIF